MILKYFITNALIGHKYFITTILQNKLNKCTNWSYMSVLRNNFMDLN